MRKCPRRELTHPVFASLDHPLCFAKRVSFSLFSLLSSPFLHSKKGIFYSYFPHPLCEAERVEQRSAFGVSQICERQGTPSLGVNKLS
jgi:hypothetical protein